MNEHPNPYGLRVGRRVRHNVTGHVGRLAEIQSPTRVVVHWDENRAPQGFVPGVGYLRDLAPEPASR